MKSEQESSPEGAAMSTNEMELVQKQVALEELRLQRAKLAAETRQLQPRPWWRSWNITALGAIIAAILPATTAIEGCVDKRKQLGLEELREKQDISNRYLDRLKDSNERRRTLRFLAATASDADVMAWARAELPIVEQEVNLLKEDARKKAEKAEADEGAYRSLLRERAAGRAIQPTASNQRIAPDSGRDEELNDAQEAADRSRKRADEAVERVGVVSDAEIAEARSQARRNQDRADRAESSMPPPSGSGADPGSGPDHYTDQTRSQ